MPEMMQARQLDERRGRRPPEITPEVNARRGFSLVELTVVVLILGIVAGFAIPKVMTVAQDARMDGDIRSISAQLSLARMRAASAGARSRLNFNLTANTYQIDVLSGSTWTIYGGVSSLGVGDSFGFGTISTPAGQQTTIAQTSPIYFNSRGIATDSSGNPTGTSAIYLTNVRSQYAALAVTIAGQPSAYIYSGSAWVRY